VDPGEARLHSIPPPGFVGSDSPVAPPGPPPQGPAPAAPAATGWNLATPTIRDAPDAVVGRRIKAAFIDNILVLIGYVVLCAALGWRFDALSNLWVWPALGLGYHFVCESHNGQTIGKRQYDIQVRAANGGRAGLRAIGIRTLLRLIDQLPAYWGSAFISIVRTGPAKRQRIGDVLAGTKVVPAEGIIIGTRTAGWVLPAATIVSVVLSGLAIYGLVNINNRPLDSSQQDAWVAGCERSAAGAQIDCRCALDQLRADGYVTLSDLNQLTRDADAEAASGRPGPAQRAFVSSALACRR
jgi:uncharacterized RDD family membrane protein YckC